MMSYDIISIIMTSYDIISIVLSSLVATSANAGSGTDQSQRTTKPEPIVWDQPSCKYVPQSILDRLKCPQ